MNDKRVLLVEDDESIRQMYETKFKQQGAIVISAKDGVEALEKAKVEKFDLILLDIILPQLDGFSVLEELKKTKETANIPVVMLTNLSTEEDKKKAKTLGATDYIVKASLTPTELGELLKKFIK